MNSAEEGEKAIRRIILAGDTKVCQGIKDYFEKLKAEAHPLAEQV